VVHRAANSDALTGWIFVRFRTISATKPVVVPRVYGTE
jgi:hypothetical protein